MNAQKLFLVLLLIVAQSGASAVTKEQAEAEDYEQTVAKLRTWIREKVDQGPLRVSASELCENPYTLRDLGRRADCVNRVSIWLNELAEENKARASQRVHAARQKEAAAQLEEDSRLARERQQRSDLVSNLRAGIRKPATCYEWMLAKGYEDGTMSAKVLNVALVPPKGPGQVTGLVLDLDKTKLTLGAFGIPGAYLRYQDAHVFNADSIGINSDIVTYARQVGTVDVRQPLTGATKLPMLEALCIQPK